MSTDARVTKDLMQTLEDGRDGFAKASEKVGADDAALASTLLGFSNERAAMYAELEQLAAEYGDDIEESGSVAAAIHRGWLSLKDALSGSSAKGVLDAAEQGEDHAVKEFEKALGADISPTLQAVVQRQLAQVKAVHDQVKVLRDAQA